MADTLVVPADLPNGERAAQMEQYWHLIGRSARHRAVRLAGIKADLYRLVLRDRSMDDLDPAMQQIIEDLVGILADQIDQRRQNREGLVGVGR